MKYLLLGCLILCLVGCAAQPNQPAAQPSQPAAQPLPAMPKMQMQSAVHSEASYRITVTDASGAPVPGVVLNVCSADLCRVLTTDTSGLAAFTGERYAYTVKVQQAPQGYATDAELLLSPAGGAFTLVLGE